MGFFSFLFSLLLSYVLVDKPLHSQSCDDYENKYKFQEESLSNVIKRTLHSMETHFSVHVDGTLNTYRNVYQQSENGLQLDLTNP